MKSKIKSTLIQLLCVVIVASGIIAIDQTNRAQAKAQTEQQCEAVTIEPTQATDKAAEHIETSAGIGRTLKEILKNPIVVKKERKKTRKNKGKSVDQEDLYILAHVIDGEGRGEEDTFKWLVGAVVLNRVKADIYPDTIESVVFQRGQYACTWDGNYYREPEESSWLIAEHLLRWKITKKDIPEAVTYQSAAKQGETWLKYDCNSGLTCYFCFNKWI